MCDVQCRMYITHYLYGLFCPYYMNIVIKVSTDSVPPSFRNSFVYGK